MVDPLRRTVPALMVAAAICVALLIAGQASPGEKKKAPSDPAAAFDELFRTVEKAMSIDIKAGKMKLNLLSGELTVQSITLTHAKQGKCATASGVRFPFSALVGLSDPMKATTVMDKMRLGIDFGGVRFWKVSPPGGGPIPGAPSLELGKLDIKNGTLELSHGKAARLTISGFAAKLRKLKIPGKVWSQGKVPAGRWVEATLSGGKLRVEALEDVLLLDQATFHFTSTKLNVTGLSGKLEAGGSIAISGTVNMASGKPSLYDLVLDIDDAVIDRPNVTAVASGRLTIKGPPGSVKVGGKLALEDVGKLRADKWSRQPCASTVKVAVTLEPESGSKHKKAKMKGSLCQGRITFK